MLIKLPLFLDSISLSKGIITIMNLSEYCKSYFQISAAKVQYKYNNDQITFSDLQKG